MTAEEYIKDFTRGYSNELENGEYEYWLTPWQAEAACNLKKEETIEKACNWIKMNYDWIYLRYIRGSEVEDIIDAFIKAMKD